MSATLYYVHDPMCSWCWGFEPTRERLFSTLEGRVTIERLLGGLAPDSDVPMPEAMQMGLQQTWQRIEQVIPGTQFNYAFWTDCAPRRSTYPSNRAVIAARLQAPEKDAEMTRRIQQAYYQEARNPSDNSTLIELAEDIGLDGQRFADDLVAESTHEALIREIGVSRSMGIDSFPSLALKDENGDLAHIRLSYNNPEVMLDQVDALIG